MLALLSNEGNAYLLSEVLRALAEEAGSLQALEPSAINLKIEQQAILRRRLKSVPQWAYKGLETAALMGRELELPVLDKILSPNLKLIPAKELPMQFFSTQYLRKQGITLEDWLLLCRQFCHFGSPRWSLAFLP